MVEVYGRGVGWMVEAEAILDCDEFISAYCRKKKFTRPGWSRTDIFLATPLFRYVWVRYYKTILFLVKIFLLV